MDALRHAIAAVPAGRWLVGVSGGADSVALLHLLRDRSDLGLVVAHLDHQLRGDESTMDADFVRELCAQHGVECVIARRCELTESNLASSAELRRLRFEFFRRVIQAQDPSGVILAHHADDQAETVLQRLLRGGSYASLAGIAPRAAVHGVTTLHPLLDVRRDQLRQLLIARGEAWREDSSNRSPKYLRNRLRCVLQGRPELTRALLDLSSACRVLRDWVRSQAPELGDEFGIASLDDAPAILAKQAAGRWLRKHGVPAGEIDRGVIDRLRTMCADAASPSRQQFPGAISVRRRRGIISAEPVASSAE